MRLWLDTEFNEYRGPTISLGIVADDGREFYEVLNLYENPTDWVAANVMPVLGKDAISLVLFKEKLIKWLNGFESLELCVDHIADAYRFLRMLESDEQGGWYEVPKITISVITGLPGKQRQYSMIEHNALSDARGFRERHREKELAEGS